MDLGIWFILLNICAYSSGIGVWWLERKNINAKYVGVVLVITLIFLLGTLSSVGGLVYEFSKKV